MSVATDEPSAPALLIGEAVLSSSRYRRAAFVAAASVAVPCYAQPEFYVVGGLHGSNDNEALAMTPTGSTVVGSCDAFLTYIYGFWWKPDMGIQDAGGFLSQWHATWLYGVSADGRVAVGRSDTAAGGPTFRPNALRVVLGSPPQDIASDPVLASEAGAVSSDGSTVFGTFYEYADATPQHLFRWRSGAPAWEDLGVIPDALGVRAHATTPDGLVVIGSYYTPRSSTGPWVRHGFRWSQATGLITIDPFPGGGRRMDPLRISYDGTSCFGLADSADGFVVFRQVGTGDPEIVTVLPSGFSPADISDEGRVVVGAAGGHPAFWRSDTGVQDLVSVLHAGGVSTMYWTTWNGLTAVSADGRVMSGSAQWISSNQPDCFVAVPSGPLCYPNCDRSTAPPTLNVADFICFETRFVTNDTYANCDNSTTPPILNINDFLCFQLKFAAGCS